MPSGVEPAWLGENLPEPQVSKNGAEDIYTWSIINTPAYEGASLSPEKGRWLIFSLRKGIQYSLSDAASLANSLDTPPPPRVASLLKDPDRSRRGISIMEYMNDPARLDRSLPPDLVRAVSYTHLDVYKRQGHRHRPQSASLGDDVGLHLVVLGVEDPVLDPPGLQDLPQGF